MLSFKTWRSDAQASLVVFLVALPLCLGIALASNAPLAAGLFAGIIGGMVIGPLSGSPVSVSGPAAGLTVIVVNAIADLGSFEAFTLAVFFSGLFQIAFGLLKWGKLGDYFPSSVIKGMLAAIGIILILKQLPHAVGYDADFMGDEAFFQMDGQNTFSEIYLAFKRMHGGATLLAVISLVLMIFWEKAGAKGNKFFKLIPGALVAVALSLVLNYLFQMTDFNYLVIQGEHLVRLPFTGGVDDFLGSLKMPNWSYLTLPKIYMTALTIAIVGSLESLLSVDAADKIDGVPKASDKNRELFAQGIGNTLSGLIGGLPVTAVIVRTSANVAAGARSNLSAFFHGFWLLVCVITIPYVLNMIPLSSLAAVLLMVGYKLTKPTLIKSMYEKGWNQFIPFAATIVAILFTDLLIGIGIGMVVGFIFVIRSHSTKSIVAVRDEDQILIRFHKDVTFLQKPSLTKILNSVPENSVVTIDGSNGVFVDNDIIDLIEEYQQSAGENNIQVEIKRSPLALHPFFKAQNHATN